MGARPVRVKLRADCSNGRLMQYIAHYAKIRSQTFTDSAARIDATIPANRIEGLRRFEPDVQIVRQGEE